MNAVICDDNHAFAETLNKKIRNYCADHNIDFQCNIYASPFSLFADKLDGVQVFFLDIDMPDLNGIDTAYRLRQRFPEALIVFVTAWIQYAPYGYHVSAFRYLLKSRLEQELYPCLNDIYEKLSNSEMTIDFCYKEGKITFPSRCILYISGTKSRNICIHTVQWPQNKIECVGSLKEYEKELENKGFLRVQRSYLVNLGHITKLSNYEVHLSDGEILNTSRKYFNTLKSAYLIWKGETL